VKAIIEARESGPFRSLFDFAERIEQGTIGKRALESLVSAGAFDSLKPESRSLSEWRGQIHGAIDTALARAQRARRARLQGQSGLFGSETDDASIVDQVPASATGWTRTELLAAEKNSLGFYITGHPLENYVDRLRLANAVRSAELQSLASGSRVTIGGIMSDLQARTTKKGDRFALFRVEDESGGTKCVAWPDRYHKHSSLLQNELPALVTGRLELTDDNPPTVIVDQVQRLDGILENKNRSVMIRIPPSDDAALFDAMLDVLNKHPGDCEVLLETFVDREVLVRVRAHAALRVDRSRALDADLKKLGCSTAIESELPLAKLI
jgi:DNA polymerase-3 subunit alpha